MSDIATDDRPSAKQRSSTTPTEPRSTSPTPPHSTESIQRLYSVQQSNLSMHEQLNYLKNGLSHFGTTVTSNGSPYATGPLSCLSCLYDVTLVYCGQMVGWINMPVRTQVGPCPGDMVLDHLDGYPGSPRKETQQPPHTLFGHVSCGQTVAHLINC